MVKIRHENLKADSEIAYSQLPSLSDPTNNTIFSVVDSASNFKLGIEDLKLYLNKSRILRKTWSAADTAIFVLTKEEVEGYELIKITIDPDLSTVSGIYTILIPGTVGNDFSVKFEIDYSGFSSTTSRILSIQRDSGAIYYDSFVIIRDSFSSPLYPRRFTFEIEDEKIRRPFGTIGEIAGSGTVGGKVPSGIEPGLVDNSGITYRLGFVTNTGAYRTNIEFSIKLGNRTLYSFYDDGLALGLPVIGLESSSSYVNVSSDGYRVLETIARVEPLNDAGADSFNSYSYSDASGSVSNSRQITTTNMTIATILFLNGELFG